VSPPTPLAELAKHLILVLLAAQQLANRTSGWSSPISLHLPRTSSPIQHTPSQCKLHKKVIVNGLIIGVTNIDLAIHVPCDDANAEHRVSGEFTGSLNRNCLYSFMSSILIDRNHAIIE
jgi:hypothetical protein